MTTPLKQRYRHSAKVALIEFLRPGGYSAFPYSIELAFQTLRHLVASGIGYKTQHHWHTTSVSGLLGARSNDSGSCVSIKSLKDLFHRFHLALLTTSAEGDRWRADKGIHVYATLDLNVLHYKPNSPVAHLGFEGEQDILKRLKIMLENSQGQATSVSLNCIHQTARVIHNVGVVVSPEGFSFELRYGFHAPGKADSEWNYCLAKTEKALGSNDKLDEPFLDTLRRALDQYAFVMDPNNSHLMLELHNDAFTPKKTPSMKSVCAIQD